MASQLTWEKFSADTATACFLAYDVARANLRSLFTVSARHRPYDQVCEATMRGLRVSTGTNRLAVAHVMPDEEVLRRLSARERGTLPGRYYQMLSDAGRFLAEVWGRGGIDARARVVRRGNDSSTWNLMAGAWNKLRDGWLALCHALGTDELGERQCFAKVMRLADADFAELTRIARTIADECAGGRLVSVLEGGYNLAGVAPAAVSHVRALCEDHGDAR